MTLQNPRLLPRVLPTMGAVLLSVFAASMILGLTETRAAAPIIPQSVKDNLQRRVDYGHVTGVMVGVINRDGRTFFSAGTVRAGSDTPPAPDSIFEIGSISKGFTGTLLAEMISRGEVTENDLLQSFLPDSVTVPSGATQISLLHLATHRSGLPDNPELCSPSLDKVFDCLTAERVYQLLNGHTLAREPGSAWVYSNLGAGLLGHALALKSGLSYEALLRQRILDPLGLNDTRVTLSEAQRSRRTTAHWGVVPWKEFSIPSLEGAGAVLSTANDLLTFLEHLSGIQTNLLGAVATNAIRRRAGTDNPNLEMGLGWMLVRAPNGDLVYHDGATYGQNAFLGFHRASRRGVVVLCNNRISAYGSVQDVGFHLLDSSLPLTPPRQPTAVPLETLASYEGRYQAEGLTFDARVQHGQLTLDFAPDGTPGFSVHAESTNRFGAYELGVNGNALFNLTSGAASLTWTQNGVPLNLPRIAVPASVNIIRPTNEARLLLTGTSGFAYEVHSSTDLRSWTRQGQHRPEDGEFAVSNSLREREFFQATFPPLE